MPQPTGKDEGNGVKLTFIAVGIQRAAELLRGCESTFQRHFFSDYSNNTFIIKNNKVVDAVNNSL